MHVASGREWRGGQRQVWLLARELARLGLPQLVVTGRDTELAQRLRASGVAVRETGWRAGLVPRVLLALGAEIRRGAALVHAHDAHALTLAGIAGAARHLPLVVTRRVDFPLRRAYYWRRAQCVIAVSEAVAAVLRADGIDPARITVVHSGIDLTEARAARAGGYRERFVVPVEAPLAVSVGALVPHKDHRTLLETAARLRPRCPELHWIVAGEGPLRGHLERERARLGIADRVFLPGHIPNPLGLLAEADLFVMSSREEGLGTSVLDAMARGIPVASTAAGGIPEMLVDGAGLVVPVGMPAALADAVFRIVTDPDLRAQLVERANEAVAHFSAARMAEAVLRVYRSSATFT